MNTQDKPFVQLFTQCGAVIVEVDRKALTEQEAEDLKPFFKALYAALQTTHFVCPRWFHEQMNASPAASSTVGES